MHTHSFTSIGTLALVILASVGCGASPSARGLAGGSDGRPRITITDPDGLECVLQYAGPNLMFNCEGDLRVVPDEHHAAVNIPVSEWEQQAAATRTASPEPRHWSFQRSLGGLTYRISGTWNDLSPSFRTLVSLAFSSNDCGPAGHWDASGSVLVDPDEGIFSTVEFIPSATQQDGACAYHDLTLFSIARLSDHEVEVFLQPGERLEALVPGAHAWMGSAATDCSDPSRASRGPSESLGFTNRHPTLYRCRRDSCDVMRCEFIPHGGSFRLQRR